MANNCMYEMRVVGKNKENVEKFIEYMKSGYNYNAMDFDAEYHIGGRVFEADTLGVEKEDGGYGATIIGDCAWSVWTCMMAGPHTYYNDLHKEYGDKCRSLSLEVASAMLNLDIEVFSEEPGMAFSEHYLIKHGDVLISEETEYIEHWFECYGSMEDFIEKTGVEITEEQWKYNDYVVEGGYGEYVWSI